MFRYIKALWYFCTGRFTAAAEALQENKYVMAATYDQAIDKSGDRFNTVKEAVADLMRIEKTKVSKLKGLTEQIERFGKIKQAAGGMLQKRSKAMQGEGKGADEIKIDPEIIKHTKAFQDSKRTLADKSVDAEELEGELDEYRNRIATYKSELQAMQRSHQKLKEEKSEAIADVAVAQQLDSINSVLAGVDSDSTDSDLQAARAARQKAKARSEITAELAGNDARLAEQEYMDYSSDMDADDELSDLLGLDSPSTDTKQASLDPSELPE